MPSASASAGARSPSRRRAIPSIPPPIPVGKDPALRRYDRRRQARLHPETRAKVPSAPNKPLGCVAPRSNQWIPVGPLRSGQTSPPSAARWSSPMQETVSTSSVSTSVFLSLSGHTPSQSNCDPKRLVDAVLWHYFATVPVRSTPHGRRSQGIQPTAALLLASGSPNLPCAAPTTAQPLGSCTVSVINLATNTVTATSHPRRSITVPLPASTATPPSPSPAAPTRKVYVTSPESTSDVSAPT